MNSVEVTQDAISRLIGEYKERLLAQLQNTWQALPLDLSQNEVFEVAGALMARQTTLAIQLASSPNIWNSHTAPVLLRVMCDAYITLAWVLKDPLTRARKFIYYGLGQQKLNLEHRKKQLSEDGVDPDADYGVKGTEQWINSQRWSFLTEVNVGSWSDISTREMAEEADCLDFYRYSYSPFSSAVHSTWLHVGQLNLKQCANSLHMLHKVPDVPELGIEPFYLSLAAKYAEKTFRLVRTHFSIADPEETAFLWMEQALSALVVGEDDGDASTQPA